MSALINWSKPGLTQNLLSKISNTECLISHKSIIKKTNNQGLITYVTQTKSVK